MRRITGVDLAAVAALAAALPLIAVKNAPGGAPVQLLNVSYDPTRELYREINARFSEASARTSGRPVQVVQSHGGSSRQASLVASGALDPDVVTLGLPSDIDALQRRGLIAEDWPQRLPAQSRPYYSTIVFVVRRGNPHAIHDWPDLVQPGVEVMTPDPKTSGNGKLTALAAWGSVVTRGGDAAAAQRFLKALYSHAPFLSVAAREAGVAFAVEKIGDVHVAWENEALREVGESDGALEIVYPPVSIRAEPAVAWVDSNVERHGTAALARSYLQFLFSDEAQEIIARNGYRPASTAVLQRHARELPPVNLFAVTAIAHDWDDAQARFFAENGLIDTVYEPKPR